MRIVLAGSLGLIRDGLARILADFADCVDVRCVDSPTAESVRGESPDLIVLDGDFGPDASALVNAIHDRLPPTPVVVLLTTIDRAAVDKLLRAGTAGCVEKSASSGVLLGALRLVLAGGVYLPPSLLAVMAEKVRTAPLTFEQPKLVQESHDFRLTARQVEILALAARGESNKAIARQLDISEGTVKIHLTAVYRTLKVNSRSQAASVAMRCKTVVDEQVRRAFAGTPSIGRLIPHMTRRHCNARAVLFRKGDTADGLYYIVRGVVHLEDLGLDVGAGALLGELGLFTHERKRTSTARCKTDSELLSIPASDVMQIYYQDPEFAIYLTRLIAQRLEADRSTVPDAGHRAK